MQQVEHDWNVIITKRKNAAGATVYVIRAEGGCNDPGSSVQAEKKHKDLVVDSVAFSGAMTLVQLRDAIEAALLNKATGQ